MESSMLGIETVCFALTRNINNKNLCKTARNEMEWNTANNKQHKEVDFL